MKFEIEFTTKAVKDLNSFSPSTQKKILKETLKLEKTPLPFKKRIKKIKGMKFPCYRLRIDLPDDSLRVFYGIEKDTIFVLRIVSRKDAEKILKSIKKNAYRSKKP
jgi:mRNA-degrading endonuclease RelE of RelBE toxin-antitoxin system